MVRDHAQHEGRVKLWRRTLAPADWYESGGARTGRDWVVDWAVFVAAVAFGGFTQVYLWGDHGAVLDSLDVAFGALACLALLVRRSMPVAVFMVAAVAASFSPLALGAGLVAIFNAALRVRGRALGALGVLMVLGSVIFPLLNPKAGEVVKPAVPAFLLTVIAFGFGLFLRARRELIASLRERAHQLEADQELRTEAAREAERRRIAREMHDVLAHRLSLLAIHAGALEFRPDAPAGEIAQAASVIRTSAATALDELSQVITVLREDTPGETAAPQPTLDDLPKLFDESRGAGMCLHASIDLLAPESVSTALGRTAYRVVQEGLTNARKHAPSAEVNLAVSRDEHGGLVVEVVSHPSASTPPTDRSWTAGARSGLAGLAERLALIGGTLEHGPDGNGNFVLRATVPGA